MLTHHTLHSTVGFKAFSFLLWVLLLFSAQNAKGQTLITHTQASDNSVISFTWQHPKFGFDNDFRHGSGLYDIKANYWINPNISFKVEIPVAKYPVRDYYEKQPHFPTTLITGSQVVYDGVGNTYMGFQAKGEPAEWLNSFHSFGIFLPFVDIKHPNIIAMDLNLRVNILDYEKCIPDRMGFKWMYGIHSKPGQLFVFGSEAGLGLCVPVRNEKAENIWIFHYGTKAGIDYSNFLFLAELTGIVFLSDSRLTIDDRHFTSCQIGAGCHIRRVVPMLFYRSYLTKSAHDLVSSTLGVQVSYYF